MIDVTSNEFWDAIQKQYDRVMTRPGMEIQLWLAAISIAIALLVSLLTQRLTARRFPPGHKYHWVADSLLPTLLSPALVIIFLLIGTWIFTLLLPFHTTTISGFTKVAMVWLVARILLYIAQRHFMAYLVSSVLLVLTLLSATNLLGPAQDSLNEISFEMSSFRLSLLGVIKGTFSLIVLFWGAGVLSKTGERWLRQLSLSFNARELSIKFLRISLYTAASILTLNEMGVDLTALTVFGGALAVGLGFGLQKITSNFISGIILLFERTIQAGDLIQLGSDKGWVRQLAIRHTLIETADGREMLIPNEDLITSRVTNWTYTNTRARIDITLTTVFSADPDLVLKLLVQAANEYPGHITDPAPTAMMSEFTDHGMQFLLTFWIPDIKQGMSIAKSDVMLRIARAFKASGIEFAKA
jgi:small-conductance mechanosensitive channel